jgi:hypothetical protein
MKKVLFSTFAVLFATTIIIGCGGKPKVEVSKDMQSFVEMFKGKSADVQSALNQFANEELKSNDMTMYDLSEITVTTKEGDCYTFEAKAGITTRTYKVCWTNGKINTIEDLGMK